MRSFMNRMGKPSSQSRRISRPLIPLLAMLCLSAIFTGCATQKPQAAVSVPDERVILGPGDQIDIKFLYAPELNESQTIRPDGKISLQLAGDVEAQGRTPDELGKYLVGMYTKSIERPQLTVVVKKMQSRAVYVSGAVFRPGRIEMPSPMTLLEAVTMSGGFDMEMAELGNIIVIRNENGLQRGYAVDVRSALKGRTFSPFYLRPLDIVYVPRTTITDINMWIQQHINNIIPQLPVRYTHPTGGDTYEIDTTQYRSR